MKNYFRNWNFMRLLRLAMGILIIVQGFMDNQWMFVALGGLFSLMPFLNIGCYGTSSCSISLPKSDKKTDEITYEEVR